LNGQSLTKARYVSGLFVFPKDALRWSWQQRDFTPQIQMRRCRQLHAQEFVANGCEAMSVLHRSVRKKLFRIKPVERKFFLTLFLLSQNRAARFSPSMDVITFQVV